MLSLLTLHYVCRECREDFGDPEEQLGHWRSWEMAVIMHMFDEHAIKPGLLNDMVVALWGARSFYWNPIGEIK